MGRLDYESCGHGGIRDTIGAPPWSEGAASRWGRGLVRRVLGDREAGRGDRVRF